MSSLFEHLRSRLAGVFNLVPDAQPEARETRGITLTAYLPDEDSAIEAVFAVGRRRKIAAASARRIEDGEELSRAGQSGWSLALTFYVAAAERERLEAQIAADLAPFGGRLALGEEPPRDRRAA
jgi:hypothetical protein